MNTAVLLTLAWHVLMPVPTVSNGWKKSCSSKFDHLELTNAMRLLMMPLVTCDANTDITWLKGPCFILFQSSCLITNWCHLQCPLCHVILGLVDNSITWKKVILHSCFSLSSPNEKNDTTDHHLTAMPGTHDITWVKKSCFTSFFIVT